MPDLRLAIQSALQVLASNSLRGAATSLLKTFGYESGLTLILEGSKPKAFLDLIALQGDISSFDAVACVGLQLRPHCSTGALLPIVEKMHQITESWNCAFHLWNLMAGNMGCLFWFQLRHQGLFARG